MKVSVCTSAEEMRRIEPLWRRLFQAADHTRFQSYEWNVLAAQVFAEREALYVVAVESDQGAAIIPAAVRLATSEIVLLGEELFDYRDILWHGDESVLLGAWQELASLNLGLSTVVRGEPKGLWSRFDKSYFSAALYGRAGEAPENATLVRNWRRLMRLGLQLRVTDGSDQQTIREMYERKAAQSEDCLFRGDAQRIAMVYAMAKSAPGEATVFSLWQRDHLVSACLTFRDGGWRRIYGTYYDHEWARYSPGITLMHHAIQDGLRQRLNADFMTGEQEYKTRILSQRVPLYRLTASAERLAEIAESKALEPIAA